MKRKFCASLFGSNDESSAFIGMKVLSEADYTDAKFDDVKPKFACR